VQSVVDSFDTPFIVGAEGLVEGSEGKFYNMAWMFRPDNPPEGQPAPFPAPYTLHETVPGPGPASFTDPVQMGILLCFDLTNPGLVRKLATENDLLVMMTNLQGFDGSPTKRILRGLAQLRAAEAGRYLVIASNTGPTGIVDPSGRVMEWSTDGRQSVSGTIWLTKRPSWYVIYGYRVLWVVWAIGFAFSAWNVYPRRRKGGDENDR
jgi:apolipoprotein N-acyltransferase